MVFLIKVRSYIIPSVSCSSTLVYNSTDQRKHSQEDRSCDLSEVREVENRNPGTWDPQHAVTRTASRLSPYMTGPLFC